MAKKSKNSKSEYIRKHSDLSVSDLIAKSATDGQAVTAGLIYTVRSQDKKKSKTGKRKATKSKASGTTASASASSAKVSKAEFVRQQGSTLTAKEVVAAGAKAGVKLTEKYVYGVRADAKASKKKVAKAAKATKAAAKAAPTTAAGRPSAGRSATLEAIVWELGIGPVKAMLSEIERKVSTELARH